MNRRTTFFDAREIRKKMKPLKNHFISITKLWEKLNAITFFYINAK